MRYPMINKQPRRTVNVPDLVGGINLRDGVSGVLDNQLTECKNMWHHNGLLRTRPNLVAHMENNVTVGTSMYAVPIEQKEHRDIQKKINNKTYVLFSYLTNDDIEWSGGIRFWWQGKTEVIQLPTIINSSYGRNTNYFVTEKSGVIYCFANNYANGENESDIYKLNYITETEWTLLTDDDIYKPLAYTNCKPDGEGNNFEGVQLEGLNLIGNQFRMVYSTVNTSLLSPTKTTHLMYYVVPHCANPNAVSNLISVFKAKITYASGSIVTHTFSTKEGSEYWESAVQSDGLKMMANPIGNNKMLVSFVDSEGQFKTVSASNFLENNMEIIAPCENPNDNYKKVFNMTQSDWFGGGANGINGGSRLFLGGNTTEGSLMVWSARDNPLYFPENNYAYVGKSSNAITAFGKQDDMLVILKETETYYTHYVQNNITADDLINQTVIDYQASSVYFPLVQLNAEIGCNVPNSVQLCRNRLVWANTNGSIYTLVTANQYSERNIFKLSAMIERDVVIPTDATSADWNGYYCLMCENKMWLLKYDSYGYQYVSSYSKTEDAALKMPWFMWDFPFANKYDGTGRYGNLHISLLDDTLIVSAINEISMPVSYWNHIVSSYTLNSENENTEDELLVDSYFGGVVKSTSGFESIVQTKLFDFGLPSHLKNVDVVNIGLGNNGGVPVSVSFMTDKGTDEEEAIPYGSELTAYHPAYINNYRISPCIRNVCRFGVRLKCNGVLAVDNLNLQYRLLGGTK